MKLNEINSIVKTSLQQYDYCVSWNVNKLCNYHCYFCSQGDNNSTHFSKEDLDKNYQELLVILDRMNKELEELNDKHILINLIGGEPTLSDLPSLLKNFNPGNNSVKIIIITNLSCGDNYIDELRRLKSKNVKIILDASLHETETNVDAFIDKVKRNADIIKSVNIVIHDENSINVYNRICKEIGSIVNIRPKINNMNGHISLDESLIQKIHFPKKKNILVNENNEYDRYELISQIAEENNQCPNFMGYKCNPFIKINHGKIYHCMASNSHKEYDKIFQIDEIICNTNTCRLCNFVKIER